MKLTEAKLSATGTPEHGLDFNPKKKVEKNNCVPTLHLAVAFIGSDKKGA